MNLPIKTEEASKKRKRKSPEMATDRQTDPGGRSPARCRSPKSPLSRHPRQEGASRGEPEPVSPELQVTKRSVPKGAEGTKGAGSPRNTKVGGTMGLHCEGEPPGGEGNCSAQERERRSGQRGRRENGDSENVGKERKGGDRSTSWSEGRVQRKLFPETILTTKYTK